jgi:Peptidase C13 family
LPCCNSLLVSGLSRLHLNPESQAAYFLLAFFLRHSVAWMEDTESHDMTRETLLKQYKVVKQRTSNNFTYSMVSPSPLVGEFPTLPPHLPLHLKAWSSIRYRLGDCCYCRTQAG